MFERGRSDGARAKRVMSLSYTLRVKIQEVQILKMHKV